MTIAVRRFQVPDLPAIERLDSRLADAGLPHRVGQEPRNRGEPNLEREPLIERLYVAADGEEILGGAWLKEQLFWSGGQPVQAGWIKYPVAESLIDGRAAGVAAGLLFQLLRQQRYLMALGMGGHAGRFAQILAAARWANSSLPLFFRFLHPSRVLRQLWYARKTAFRRVVADVLAFSGLAWVGNALVMGARAALQPRPAPGYASSVVERFDGWADDLWAQCRDAYGLIAVRDSRALNALYPDNFRSLTRLRVRQHGRDAGWICARSFTAGGTWFERHFGNLKLGILTDCLAQPGDALAVMHAGCRYLTDAGTDVIVTYQSHPAWAAAALHAGLLRGPSNSAFYRAPAVEALIARAAADGRGFHLTSSDGDGPESV